MHSRVRVLIAVGAIVVLFLGVQLGALALVDPFVESERQAVENPDDPANSLLYFGVILLATVLMLAAFKYDAQWAIRGLIVAVCVMLSWFVFTELLATLPYGEVIALLAALGVGAALVGYPEWYVIDTAGVLIGAGAAGLFGISFGLLPAILLLVVLAIYDAISVYKTKHMLDLAEGVMDLKIPVVLVIPTSLSYSYLTPESTEGVIEHNGSDAQNDRTDAAPEGDTPPDAALEDETSITPERASPDGSPLARDDETDESPDGDTEEPRDDETDESQDADYLERDALFIGLGDAVIPTILVASAAYFLDVGMIDAPVIALNVPALGAMIGTLLGLLVLLHMVLKGRPHAGLPLLNGGAIGGYLIGALASGLTLTAALGL